MLRRRLSESHRWMIVHPPLVFVHGAGRSGRANWPVQQAEFLGAAYMNLSGYGDGEPTAPDIQDWATQILDACKDGAHLVAHSYGAIPAVEAAAASPSTVHSMTLLEPALYSSARGAEHVESHIARMSPVVGRAPHLTAAEYLSEWFTAIGAPESNEAITGAELRFAERLRLLPAPWMIPTSEAVFSEIPVLVITGGWNDEYEEIALALVQCGATHQQLTGSGHRVQDHSAVNTLIREWAQQHRTPTEASPRS